MLNVFETRGVQPVGGTFWFCRSLVGGGNDFFFVDSGTPVDEESGKLYIMGSMTCLEGEDIFCQCLKGKVVMGVRSGGRSKE